jgi:hypothetical protein
MCRLGPHEGMQLGVLIFEGNHIEDAVLAALEEDQITRLNGRRYMGDPQIMAGHVVDANGELRARLDDVPLESGPHQWRGTVLSWRASVREHVLHGPWAGAWASTRREISP